MAKSQVRKRERGNGLPLSARLSLLVLFAAILPLAAVVGINDTLARATLEQQGRAALTTDAQAKASLVEEYLHERILDGQAITTLPTAPAFLICAELPAMPAAEAAQLAPLATTLNCQTQESVLYEPSNCRGLMVGVKRDPNYTAWTLYDARGDALLSSSHETPDETQCPARGSPAVSADILEQVVPTAASWISPVYSDAAGQNAFVDVYTSVTLAPVANNNTVVGFVRATLNLNYVNGIMQGETGADGTGSYAFITDSNGIRIADSNQSQLFTSVMPLSSTTKQQIDSSNRFGTATQIQEDLLPSVASSLQTPKDPDSFQSVAAPGSSTMYQFVRVYIKLVNTLTNATIPIGWSYFVLSPISTVTAVANSQLKTSLMIAAVIAVLAILLGLITGRQIARPVHRATADLEGAAEALKTLASRQQSSAGEQQWVVDACKTGLDSVSYLSDAMNQAAKRIVDASNWFSEYWDRLNEDQARRTVQHLLELARYIDEAARRQQASNDRLGKAITVTDQVSDQLVAGAAAATESADQLEQVVSNLQRAVGGKRRSPTPDGNDETDQGDAFAVMAMPAALPPGVYYGPQSRRLEAPVPMGPGAPRAPQAPWNSSHPSQTFDNPESGYGYNGQSWAGTALPAPNSGRPRRSDQ
ncbi:MAG: cache domain-containing protein [Ktedonobacterales bacterium]